MIQQWHAGIFGKQVQHSAMGTVKGKLKNSSKVRMIERSYPSTQVCPVCGKLTKHPLSQREYQCMHCGYHHDSRDQKAAQSILAEAIRQVSVERRAQSPVEDGSTAVMPLGIICKNPPVKQEACDFSHRQFTKDAVKSRLFFVIRIRKTACILLQAAGSCNSELFPGAGCGRFNRRKILCAQFHIKYLYGIQHCLSSAESGKQIQILILRQRPGLHQIRQ